MDRTPTPNFTQTPTSPSVAPATLSPSALSGTNTVLQQIANNQLLLLAAFNAKFPSFVAAPTTTASPGAAGQVAVDATYFYVFVDGVGWGRILLDFAF